MTRRIVSVMIVMASVVYPAQAAAPMPFIARAARVDRSYEARYFSVPAKQVRVRCHKHDWYALCTVSVCDNWGIASFIIDGERFTVPLGTRWATERDAVVRRRGGRLRVLSNPNQPMPTGAVCRA